MIAIPDVRQVALNGGEDFLILACDGLWDFLTEDDAARMVYNMVRQNPGRKEIYKFVVFGLIKKQKNCELYITA